MHVIIPVGVSVIFSINVSSLYAVNFLFSHHEIYYIYIYSTEEIEADRLWGLDDNHAAEPSESGSKRQFDGPPLMIRWRSHCTTPGPRLLFWNPFNIRLPTHILALLINSTEAGNLLRGNDALHAMLDARTRARVQLVLVTRMSICLIARLLVQATPQSR